jgi:hypothetical protein
MIGTGAFSQTWVNQSRGTIRHGMNKYLKKNGYIKSTIKEDDESLTVSIREDSLQPADFYYHFNVRKCDWLKVLSNCDSCLRKDLDGVLGIKKAGWQKIGKDKWVSKYSKNLQIDVVSAGGEFYYTIRRVPWTKQEYAALLTAE